MQVYVWILLPTALLLPPGAWSGWLAVELMYRTSTQKIWDQFPDLSLLPAGTLSPSPGLGVFRVLTGTEHPNPSGEIIGGREARPHSRPYMACLKVQRGQKKTRCGGFLVSEDVVLTAAHCNGDQIMVYLGAHNVKRKRERRRQVIPVDLKIPHPQFHRWTLNNDIMLLQLKKKAELNKYVNPISLPQAHQRVPPGTVCSVTGWGQTSTDREQNSDTLQEVDLGVMPDATCRRIPKRRYRHYKPSTMLCAGDPEENKSSFKGDSGGPLVCDGMAQGIVSFGKGDGSPPRVFTRVSAYIPWIKGTMRKLRD